MSIFRILVALILCIALLGAAWLALVDIPVRQTEITKPLPKEAYTNAE
ncbi:MAG: hypothetical protein KDI90_06015 [Alphaproteobacteria bacterium]|nr:hypothetical protein [Alphaproteobacteria bacterium]MCB9974793.1 hypothetical protein [Rhodospirillales bacterium]